MITGPCLSQCGGLMARYAGDGNFYYPRVGDNNQLSLRKVVNGSSFELDRKTLVVRPGTWSSLRLEVLGNALRGYFDGRLILAARDQSHPVGKYGLATFRTAARFDNVEVVQP